MKNLLSKLPFGKKKTSEVEDDAAIVDNDAPKGRKKKSFISKEKVALSEETEKTTFQPLQSKSLLSDEDIRAKSHHAEDGKPHPKKNKSKETFFASLTSRFSRNKEQDIPVIKTGEGKEDFFPDLEVDDSNQKSRFKGQISPVRALILIIIVGGAGWVVYDLLIGGDGDQAPVIGTDNTGRTRKPPPKRKKAPVKKKEPAPSNVAKTEVSKPKELTGKEKQALNNSVRNKIKEQMKEVGAANKADFAEKDLMAKRSNMKERLEKLNNSPRAGKNKQNEINKESSLEVEKAKVNVANAEVDDLDSLSEELDNLELEENKATMNDDFGDLEQEKEDEKIEITNNLNEEYEEKRQEVMPGDPSKINKILEKLDKKYTSILQKKTELSYESPPEYGYIGKGLVYNCAGKHWACIDASSFAICENNYFSTKFRKAQTECFPYSVYTEIADCSKIQQFFINTAKKTEFCYK